MGLILLILVVALAVALGTASLRKPRTREEMEFQQEQRVATRANNMRFALFIALAAGIFFVAVQFIKMLQYQF